MTTSTRHAEAVAARRAELGENLAGLAGSRLRSELALAQLAARSDLSATLQALRAACHPWLRRDPAGLARVLPPALEREMAGVQARAAAEGAAAVRRVAGRMLGPVPIPAELLVEGTGRARLPAAPAEPDLPLPTRTTWAEALLRTGGGAGLTLRLVLVLLAGVPALGLTVTGLRPLLPLALGVAVTAACALAHRQRAALRRDRWAAWLAGVLRAAEERATTALLAAAIAREQRAAEILDRPARDRRAALTAELRALEAVGAH